ncbi:MAG: hypothetical protein AB7R69_01405 [Candidatus Babeliales bacterium]
MKTLFKKNRKHLALALLALVATFGAYRFYQGLTQQQAIYEAHGSKLSAKEYFGQLLTQELDCVWKAFEKIGITKKRYEDAKNNYRNQYLRSDFPGGSIQVSDQTKQFVNGILKELGVDPATITITGWDDISPAAATEHIIYINEKEFSNYSLPARRFIIGHEIQHILHKDNWSRYSLELLCNNEVEKMAGKKDHPLCQYSRFKEKRADVTMATTSKEWAEGYLAFAKEWHKRAGDNPGVTHPLNKDRVALAQDIVTHMKRSVQSA